MRKLRVALTVALVTTAVCADRALAAAPALRPNITLAARQFADRLAVNLRQTVLAPRLRPERREEGASVVPMDQAPARPVLHASELSPFQFRLPPPQTSC